MYLKHVLALPAGPVSKREMRARCHVELQIRRQVDTTDEAPHGVDLHISPLFIKHCIQAHPADVRGKEA
jgi:hypothetical protein